MIKIVVFLVLFGFGASADSVTESKLRYVIDGDTVVMKDDICRLSAIDSPESKRNKKASRDITECSVSMEDVIQSGRYAKRYLKSKMRKGKLYTYIIKGHDRYKRAICQFEDINDDMVKNGFAVPFWRYVKPSEKAKMKKLVNFAKENKKGLWRIYPKVMDCMNSK